MGNELRLVLVPSRIHPLVLPGQPILFNSWESKTHSGGVIFGSFGDPVSRLMSGCPIIEVVGGVTIPCLLDTGSMVSAVTLQYKPWGSEHLQSCHWIQLRAANQLAIPCIGY